MIAAAIRERMRARLVTAADADTTPAAIAALVRAEAPLLSDADVAVVAAGLAADVTGLGPLEAYLTDPDVTEVMVNAGTVWVERHGRMQRVDGGIGGDAAARAVERIIGPLGLRVDRTSPIVDARLPDGSRVCVVIPPVAVDGICVAVRRFAPTTIGLDRFCAGDVAAFLKDAVADRLNMLVAGGASAGKTTLLNALAGEIDAGERIVTIEDAAELRLPQPHVVRLEARPPNAEGAGAVSIRALLRAALRLRPDRIIVGEVRDGAALDMLQALNTGHAGSFSTCHANGTADALRRLETMALMGGVELSLDAVREHIAAAVDLVVLVGRADGGRRRVVEVAEVAGTDWRVRSVVAGDAVVGERRRPSRRSEGR